MSLEQDNRLRASADAEPSIGPSAKSHTPATAPPDLPPGPRMPSFVQAVGWSRRPLAFMERCQRHFGDTFTLRLARGETWVVVCDPRDVKRVFTADPDTLGVSEANPLLGPLLGHRSVMLLEEPEHMPRRKLMLAPFHGRRMDGYAEMMSAVTRREIDSWPIGEPFELWPRMQTITLEVILHVVFGSLDSEHVRRLRELLLALTTWLNDPGRLASLSALSAVLGARAMARDPSFQTTREAMASTVLAEVRRRREARDARASAHAHLGMRASEVEQAGEQGVDGEDERDDVLALLESARYEDGSPLSDRDLCDEAITLLLDGPTSTSLAWTFERLLRHPDKLERLRREVDEGEEDIYLDAVVREAMRLCPPVAVVARRLLAPLELGGYEIPAGVTVAPCVYLMHRRAEVYPNPRAFVPERFLGKTPGTYTWIPFGGGSRRCLAASFATTEMKRVVHTVLSEVELRPRRATSERVTRSSIAFAPGGRALAVVTGRRTSAPAAAGPVT
jgi:cytochrome P450